MTYIKLLCYMMLQEVCILHVGLQNGYRIYVMLLQCLWGKHKLGDDDALEPDRFECEYTFNFQMS